MSLHHACICVAVALLAAPRAAGQCQPAWAGGFGSAGADWPIMEMAVLDWGEGPRLAAAGYFEQIGGVDAVVAAWDGVRWKALATTVEIGSGLPYFRSLTLYDNGGGPAVVVGGRFTSIDGVAANSIARWNGATWSNLGAGVRPTSGFDDGVWALNVFDDGTGPRLFVGGVFRQAGALDTMGIAAWGGPWAALGTGMAGGFPLVDDMVWYDDGMRPGLYAVGLFLSAGGANARSIARWDGVAWSALDPCGLSGSVNATSAAVHHDGTGPALYVCGGFDRAGCAPSATRHIAKWDGVGWSGVGGGFPFLGPFDGVHVVRSLDVGGGARLYVGGRFTEVGGVPVEHVAMWDGIAWRAVGNGMAVDGVYSLAAMDLGEGPVLLAAGSINEAGGRWAGNIVCLEGDRWLPLGNGFDPGDEVHALAGADDGSGPALYAGGAISRTGDVGNEGLVRWKDGLWSALPEALGSSSGSPVVHAILPADGGGPIIVGGEFDRAGQRNTSNIARWKGTAWQRLGAGVDGPVKALVQFDAGMGSAVFAGGSFASAGGVTAHGIAEWRDETWWSVAGGTNGAGDVRALCAFDDGAGEALYAGGLFSEMGGGPAANIARWDGANWTSVGGGTDGAVQALTVFDDGGGAALYAGGSFSTAGSTPVSNIARWNGTSWSPVGGGVDGEVLTLHVHDDGRGAALFAGGAFENAGGAPARGVARWDGAAWSDLGGLDHPDGARAVAMASFDDGSGPALWVGGRLRSAAGEPSCGIAKWTCPATACEPCDVNCDGAVDAFDIEPFVTLLVDPNAQRCSGCAADINADGVVDAFDIEPFVGCLVP